MGGSEIKYLPGDQDVYLHEPHYQKKHSEQRQVGITFLVQARDTEEGKLCVWK